MTYLQQQCSYQILDETQHPSPLPIELNVQTRLRARVLSDQPGRTRRA